MSSPFDRFAFGPADPQDRPRRHIRETQETDGVVLDKGWIAPWIKQKDRPDGPISLEHTPHPHGESDPIYFTTIKKDGGVIGTGIGRNRRASQIRMAQVKAGRNWRE